MDLADVLDSVPPNTSQYPYKGPQDFWRLVAQAKEDFHDDQTGRSNPYMLFTNIDLQTFTNDFDITKHESAWKLLDSYYPSLQLLLVRTVTTKTHEVAHTSLENLLITKLAMMGGINLSLMLLGAANMETASRIKRAAQGFAPLHCRTGRSDWPTLVLEAGYSQSESKLESDAKWWVKESKGDVKMAITVSVHRKKKEIIIQKWAPKPICFGHRSSRNRTQVDATLQQSVAITKSDDNDYPKIGVANGPLLVSFEDLFLRRPEGDERDIWLTDSDLEKMAETVWRL